MPTVVQIEEFLKLSETLMVLDVRAPAEFEQGHIPKAHNLPLFSNDERKIVGTIYKQQGRQSAILKGLELVGPKMKKLVEAATKISPPLSKGEGLGLRSGTFLIHCWRGGMRSASLAWLLELYGAKVYILKGGYKSYRKIVLQSFADQRKKLILGGRTGANKTQVLKELEKQGEHIIDLEKIAHHKGSAFGSIGEEEQPSQEQFENELALQLNNAAKNKTIWLEDESRLVGKKVIPDALWTQMRNSKVVYLDIPFEERAKNLTELYGKYPPENLIAAIDKIKKRLGLLNAKTAIEFIHSGELKKACEIILLYYDKTYDYGMSQREVGNIIKCNFDKSNAGNIANEIKKYSA